MLTLSAVHPSALLRRAGRRVRWEAYMGTVNLKWSIWDLLSKTQRRPASTVYESWEQSEALPETPFAGRHERRRVLVEKFHEQCLLEPEFGYLINGHAVPQRALTHSDYSRSGDTMCFFSGVPSLPGYARARLGRSRVQREKSVISLRGLFDDNYYHALVEILAKLPILDRYVPSDTPVVISPTLARQPFFQSLKTLPGLRDRNWLVQDGFYVAADEIWVCGLQRPGSRPLHGLLDLLGGAPTTDAHERRIFLNRSRARRRALLNVDQLLPVFEASGLEVVDTDEMSVFEQMKLFAHARLVVGIHGAGLTNLLFRGGRPTQVLEIYPPLDADPSFYLMSKDLGYDWHHVCGHNPSSKERHADFELDPQVLERSLQQLTAQA
jgi:Glycosyltransferase 61